MSFPRNEKDVALMRIAAVVGLLILLILTITGCFGKIERTLPEPPATCIRGSDADGNLPNADLPMPPERPTCTDQACLDQKAEDFAINDKRAEAAFDSERAYRQSCLKYIKRIRE